MNNKTKKRTIQYIVFAAIFLTIFSYAFYTRENASIKISSNNNNTSFKEIKKLAYEDGELDMAIRLAKTVLSNNPNLNRVRHFLARAYLVKGDFKQAKYYINEYIKNAPNDKRALYLLALIEAAQKDLNSAERHMEEFVKSRKASWPGYLDLAWIQFQLGRYNDAYKNINYAINRFGENAWLLINKAAVLIALDRPNEAKLALKKAEEALNNTPRAWFKENYRLSNEKSLNKIINSFYDVIAINKAAIEGGIKPELISRLSTDTIARPSAEGFAKGVMVSACGDTCVSVSCTSPVCGFAGTRSSCGGACSAQDPANVGSSCSINDLCGNERTGSISCSGSCSVSAYSVKCDDPNTPEDETVTVIIPPSLVSASGPGGAQPTDVPAESSAILAASPNIVREGQNTTLTVFGKNTTSCIISGDNGFSSGELQTIDNNTEVYTTNSNNLNSETVFIARCNTIYNTTIESNEVIVKIAPRWNEQ